MRARVHGALVAKPITFPDDLEIHLFPVRSHDDSQIGPSYSYAEHRSWDEVLTHYPLNRQEAEPHIKAGEPIRIFTGHHVATFPKGMELPEGSEFVSAITSQSLVKVVDDPFRKPPTE
jgi:hypothetical protein